MNGGAGRIFIAAVTGQMMFSLRVAIVRHRIERIHPRRDTAVRPHLLVRFAESSNRSVADAFARRRSGKNKPLRLCRYLGVPETWLG